MHALRVITIAFKHQKLTKTFKSTTPVLLFKSAQDMQKIKGGTQNIVSDNILPTHFAKPA